MIRPKRIYICSVKSPFEIYKDEVNKQFLRRISKFYTAINDGKKVHRLIDSTDMIKKIMTRKAELESEF